MTVLTEELVSEELAILAKAVGFDIPCEKGYYQGDSRIMLLWCDVIQHKPEFGYAPTLRLLQYWLEQKHNLYVWTGYGNKGYIYFINNNTYNKYYNTYEEALEAGLFNALKQLQNE